MGIGLHAIREAMAPELPSVSASPMAMLKTSLIRYRFA
jgi:hypothetical protein